MAHYWARILEQRITRRRAVAATAGLTASAAILGACGGGSEDPKLPESRGRIQSPVNTTSQAKRGGVLKDFQTADMLHFDSLESATSQVINQVSVYAYPRLLRYKAEVWPKLADSSVEGEAAESFEVSPDGLQITLKIRRGMKWDGRTPTNGRVLDAQDVAWSWPKFVRLHANAGDLKAVDTVTAIDSNTVVMKLGEIDPSVPALLADWGRFYVMPRESDSQFDPKTTIRGHGPYILEEYVPSAKVTWTRNPDYWLKDRPFFDKIEKPIMPEYATRLAQFRAGNIYTSVVATNDLVQTMNDLPATQLYEGALFPTGMAHLITFGYDGDSIFKDARVRQALSMTVDRETFNDVIHEQDMLAKAGIEIDVKYNTAISPGFQDYWMDPTDASQFGPTSKVYTHDLAEARKLLAAAGLGAGATFDFYSNADNTYGPIYSRQREVFDGMFREGGFNPTQRLIPYGQFINNITYAYTSGNGYSGACLRASSNAATIDQFLNRQHHPSGSHFGGSTANGLNAKTGDPKSNEMIEKIKLETNKQRKQALAHEFNRYFSGQVYQIPRPGQVKALTLSWPAIGNMNVFTRPLNGNVQTEEALHWWLDDTKPPLRPA